LANLIILAYNYTKCWLLEGKKLSSIIHFEFFYNKQGPMIGLKESTFDNEAIKHLQYRTLIYIKANPYVHFN
jgi:hypothetical protein